MKEQIRKYIIENFMGGKGPLSDTESFFDSGIIDSIGFLKLLSYIEKTFKIRVKVSEVTMQNFSSIDMIERFIRTRMETAEK